MSDEEQSTQDQEVDPAKKDSAEVTVSTAGTIEGEKPAAVAEDKDAQVTDEESPKAEDSKEQKPEKESPPAPEKELPPLPPLPEQVDLNEYHQKKYADVFEMVQSYSLRLHSEGMVFCVGLILVFAPMLMTFIFPRRTSLRIS